MGITEYQRAFRRRGRVYLTETGTVGRIVIEWEFANLAECEETWDAWRNDPESAAFLKHWNAITEGSTRELLTLVESFDGSLL